MNALSIRKHEFFGFSVVLGLSAALLLLPLTARAAAFTWSATAADSTWEDTSTPLNWTGGSGSDLYPGEGTSYTDTATISVAASNAVSLSTTVKLGAASGNALTIGNYTPANAAALDITSTGILGMQGGISLSSGTTNAKKITTEGTLRNDGTSGTHYAISGGSANSITQLVGGTISSLSGGIWDFQRPVQGYGTISSPFTTTSTGLITANVSGQTLHITGAGTVSSTLSSGLNGAILSIESAITAGGTGVTIAHTGEVDLNGATLVGSSGSHFTFNNTAGAIKLTGDSTFQGNIDNGSGSGTVFALNGHTLHFNGVTMSNTSGATALMGVDTGATLDNTVGNSSITNGAVINLAGGQITNTGGGTFTISTQITGKGAVVGSATGSLVSGNSIKAIGGILTVDGTAGAVDVHGTTVFTDGAASSTLDLKGAINFGTTGTMYTNPSGLDGSGVIQLDGAILNGTTINSSFASQGVVNVVADSTLNGTYNSTATFGINSGKQFSIAGSTMNVKAGTVVTHTGSLINSGTFAIGNGVLNDSDTTGSYTLGGGGLATLAGGSITSAGGGFVSNNTLRGYGTVSAPYTNGGKVIADGRSTPQTLTMQAVTPVTNTGGLGWFAQNKGQLVLPSITVNSPASYNWGGDPTTLNMVNSIGMAFTGSVSPGVLAIAQLSTDRADVPAGLVNPIGVWAFNPGELEFNFAAMTFRYDDALATTLAVDPSNLGLLGYNGTSWVNIPTTLDSTNHLLTTTSGLSSFYQDFAIAQVPEPATLSLLALGGLATLLRRRK